MSDMTCLAEGVVYPADFAVTGLNLNEVVVGPTGCGKSVSNAYSRLLHTTESSVVVPVSKRALLYKFTKMFRRRGYRVQILDFADPGRSNIGYDPLDYIHSDADVIHLARNIIGNDPSQSRTGGVDPYWNDSATSVHAAEIALTRLKAADAGRKPSYAEVIRLHRSMIVSRNPNQTETNLDMRFDNAERRHPGNQASELWKTVRGLAPKTASCIFSIVNSALDKVFTDEILRMTEKARRVDFAEMGKQKTALFIVTSPMVRTLQNWVNVMYADMFRTLFETAEKAEDSRLRIPVHIICDDFACGSRIQDFEDYISIFRAAGISVTMLLQSETQLSSMYGEAAATTIINNCDTYVYMGGMDIGTCRNISQRMNRPLYKVMTMPLEQVVVFRRGSEPVISTRYRTLEDPVYLKLTADGEKDRE